MIRFTFDKPEVRLRSKDTAGRFVYYVGHPSNDAVLAVCDTKSEAEACAALVAALVKFVHEQNVSEPPTRNIGAKSP